MRSDIFFSIVIGIVAGMVAAMFFTQPMLVSKIWIVVIAIIMWNMVAHRLFHSTRYVVITMVVAVSFFIGWHRTTMFHNDYPFTRFHELHNEQIVVLGTVNGQPTVRPGLQKIRITPETINGERVVRPAPDIVLATTDLIRYVPGDHVFASGTFTIRSDFQSDTGRTVPYRLMSYSKKIAGDIRYPIIHEHRSADRSIHSVASDIKYSFVMTLHQLFLSPASGLIAGMMIGDTSSLDGSMIEIFRLVGLIHIVVLSGYNITLVAGSFIRMFSPLGYYRRIIGAIVALVLFIVLVGISQTALRAGIMALCGFLASYLIRPRVLIRALALALIIMVWISPYALLFDLSLQLSFLATIGIAYVFPILLEKYQNFGKNFFGEIALQTIGVTMMTIPIILYQFGYFSFVSFPLNMLVLGMIPFITIMGFFAVLVGMVIFPVGQIIAFPIQIVVDIIIRISTWVSVVDPFQINVPQFSVWIMIGVYALLFWWLIIRADQMEFDNSLFLIYNKENK